MSWIEIEHRKCGSKNHYTVRLYEGHPDNYISIFDIDRDDGSDEGYLHSLNGPGFFEFINEHVPQIYRDTGVTVLEADVLRPISIKIKRVLGKIANIDTLGSEEKFGRTFIKIRLTLKE